MMQFLSHIDPDRELRGHLQQVWKNMEGTLDRAPPVSFLSQNDILDLFRFTGLGHDFGKYTSFFQKKLRGNFSGPAANHGFISALFVYYLLEYKTEISNSGPYSLLGYMAVLHHHGNLRNIGYDTGIKDFSERKENRKRQFEDLSSNKEIIEMEYSELGINFSLDEFIGLQEEIEEKLERDGFMYQFGKFDSENKSIIYLLFVFLYSCLIDSDKRHAARIESGERRKFSHHLVDKYKKIKFSNAPDNEMNRMREEIYDKVMKSIDNHLLEKGIMSFTSPTGSGKTLTSFAAALKLRERIEKQQNYLPRIIYSLPFTSIIDQNYKVLDEVMTIASGYYQAPEEYIIKHHHLADIEYSREGKNLPLDDALMLIESWESEVIVTTFIQLFHTLLGYKNSFLKKYHNIAGSIILLDEVQNIPVKYWGLINKIFRLLEKELNCYIILLTATRPLIFKEDIKELLPDNQKYFASMGRTEIKPDLKEKNIGTFIDNFFKNYNQKKSYLIVMNTIKSSIEVYEKIREETEIDIDDIYYLSTNIYPAQRENRLDEIEKRLDKKDNIVVVATQVVEAGVDIDMDVIYRDLGPIDSLIQIAGRGNREAGKGCSPIYVYNLKEDKKASHSFCSMVYGSVHRSVSIGLLEEREKIEEGEYKNLVEEYFLEIEKAQSGITDSEKLFEACQDMKFSREEPSLSDFRLIQNKPNYIDMFVVTEESSKIWDKFEENVIQKKEFFERKKNFLELKREFYSYIISVPARLARKYIDPEKEFRGVFTANCDLEHYYDKETGFIHEEDSWDIDNRLL